MAMRRLGNIGQFVLICALALVPASPAAAQTEAAEEEEGEGGRICLPVGVIWNGSAEEVRSIRSRPVPKSFLRSGGYCGEGLASGSLVDWHRRFGNEKTALAALDFLEQQEREWTDAARLAPEAVLTALSDAKEAEAAGRESAVVLDQLRRRTYRPTYQLQSLLGPAGYAMQLAERFDSVRLRDRAAQWLAEFDRLRGLLPAGTANGDAGQPPVTDALGTYCAFLANSEMDEEAIEIRTRIALFDAERSRSEADRDRLDALIESRRTPVLDRIGGYAFKGGEDFCDLPENVDEALEKACDTNGFEGRAKIFLYNEARAAVLRGDDSEAEDFLVLYARDVVGGNGWRGTWTGIDARILDLRIAMAEEGYRQAWSDKSWGTEDVVPSDGEMQRALAQLVEVARLFSPADDPVLFGQIATRALEMHAEIAKLRRERGEELYSGLAQDLSYFRVVLRRLDEIAGGEI